MIQCEGTITYSGCTTLDSYTSEKAVAPSGCYKKYVISPKWGVILCMLIFALIINSAPGDYKQHFIYSFNLLIALQAIGC